MKNYKFFTSLMIMLILLSASSVFASDKYGGGSTSSNSSGSSYTSPTYTKNRSAAVSSAAGYTAMSSSLGRSYSYSAVSTYNSSSGWGYTVQRNEPYRSDGNSSNGYIPGRNTPVTPVVTSRTAMGYFDSVNAGNCTVQGWAYDPDNAATSIAVHVYQNGRAGVGSFVTSCQANQSRPDVNSVMRIPGNHGFNCPLPASFRNTGSRSIYIHAIDINGTPNNLLRTNGRSINCSTGTTTTTTPGTPSGCPASAPWDSARGSCYNPSTATPGTITVTAQTSVVRKLTSTNINWQISNPIPTGYTCALTGPGINIPITSQTGSRATRPIDTTSVFTVRCTNGTTPVSGEATVEIIPQVQEV